MLAQMRALADMSIDGEVLTSWEEAKQSIQLKAIFKDSLIIEKEIEIESSIEKIERDLYTADFFSYLSMGVVSYSSIHHSLELDSNEKEISVQALEELFEAKSWATNKFQKDVVFYHPDTGKKKVIQKGSKPTRMVKHFMKSNSSISEGKILTEYSKATSNFKMKGTLCLSIHPMDYLTVSTNANGWSSCFNIYEGCYRAAISGLLISPNTIVAYFKSNSSTLEFGRSNSYNWNSKVWRTLVTVTEDMERVHIGKNYPFKSSELMEEIKNMLSEATGKKYLDIEKEPNYIRPCPPDDMYDDISYSNKGIYGTCTKEVVEGGEILEKPYISPNGHICFECGAIYDSNETAHLQCWSCLPRTYCHCCDERIEEGEDQFEVIIGRNETAPYCYYCDECRVVRCDHCGEPFSEEYAEDEFITVHYGLTSEGDSDYTAYICCDCHNNDSDISFCDEQDLYYDKSSYIELSNEEEDEE